MSTEIVVNYVGIKLNNSNKLRCVAWLCRPTNKDYSFDCLIDD